MIRLTNAWDGNSIWLNPEHIVEFGEGSCGGKPATYIEQTNHVERNAPPAFVTESPEEVARKVLEWRLAMDRYRAYVTAAALDEKPQSNECWELAANAKAELVRLAGLEEPTW